MADVVRAKYRGKDVGEGLPFYAGIPARDLTDEDFDALDDAEKALVRHSNLYDYVPYTDKPKAGNRALHRVVVTEPVVVVESANPEEVK